MLNFNSQEEKEIKDFCKLNELDYQEFVKSCFDKGYQIEKYGLLTIDGQTVIEKEVIKEVPVEVIKEVVNEVIIEKPVEVVKEVIIEKEIEIPVEKIVEKEVYITDDSKINELVKKIEELESKPPTIVEKEVIKEVEVVKEIESKEKQQMLQDTIQNLREEMRKKDETILQLEKNIVELQEIKGPIKAQYMRSSNLNDNLYR